MKRIKSWWLPILPILLIIYPLWNLVAVSLGVSTVQQEISLAAYGQLLQDPQLPTVIKNTLYIAVVSTLASLFMGVVAAILTEKTDIPGRQGWRLVFILPVLLPSYVISIAWQHWAGPVGLVNDWLQNLFDLTMWDLAGINEIVIVMAISHMPIAYLLVRSALTAIPAQLEDAARIAGARPVKVFTSVVLPLTVPALANAALLCFASALDNFGIPAFIGIPSGITVLSTLIYQKVVGLGGGQFEQAAALAVVTGLLSMIPVYFQGKIFHGPKYSREEGSREKRIYPMGIWKWLLVLFVSIWQGITVVGPCLAMLLLSLAPAYGVSLTLSNLTFAHYISLWTDTPVVAAGLKNSLLLALISTAAVLLLAWSLARRIVLAPSRLVTFLDGIAAIPYCLPGMVVGLAVLLTWIHPIPGTSFSLYGGMVILLLAYIPRFYTFGIRTWTTAWARFSLALEEAGHVAGAGPMTVTRRITLPIFREEAFGGGALIFLLAFTELTLSSLLAGSQFPTLGVIVFSMEAAGRALESAALGTLLTLLTLGLSAGVCKYLLDEKNSEEKEKKA
ncbi:ABC transporter permease [Pelosinus fermentans]|uniref:ABC-type transporter, integral membrane subunit n=1 Tax=Pelosinus fermentans JBW45 TaxID=1192197 RepID=I9NP62_9FIRM|nr:iron ABC transporter permease [Pelosinus fermentans]AJQ28539.1 ABC-type transporter, integral membrane subunit [Pelosinus fermentans JBW45]